MRSSVIHYLKETVEKFPDKAAFCDQQREMTFWELDEEAKKIGTGLIKENIFARPVVVYLEKSVRCLSCFMGVAYSGNYYTPIDITMPIGRIVKIMDTLRPAVIITDECYLAEAEKFAGGGYKYIHPAFTGSAASAGGGGSAYGDA